MEPRRHRRGDHAERSAHGGLQIASMEPRRHRRGDPRMTTSRRAQRQAASMEPRRHRRGDDMEPILDEIHRSLQWSHDVTVVEMSNR